MVSSSLLSLIFFKISKQERRFDYMAVSKVFLTKRLELRLNTGLDEQFSPIYKTRSWANIKSNASDANLFELAEEIGNLQTHTVDAIRTVTHEELEEA